LRRLLTFYSSFFHKQQIKRHNNAYHKEVLMGIFIPRIHKKPRTYYLQRSSTEHSSVYHSKSFHVISLMFWYRLQTK
jgi:hypothetical protein